MKLADLDVYMHHQTEAAIKVSLDGDDEHAVWLPKSVVDADRDFDVGEMSITIPEDLAKEKGLI